MKHLSYFVALAAIGSFLLLGALEPFISIGRLWLAMALDLSSSSEAVKIGVNSAIAVLWMGLLLVYWIRSKGLAPRSAKPGHRAQLGWGHLCLIAGHVLVACIFLVKAFAFLMILPVIGVLLSYALGIALIELARDRSAKATSPGE